jgi:hypothetical protein
MKKERESGIELLRVVAMSMILILHFMTHGFTRKTMAPGMYCTLSPFVSGGISLFFLITGWFGVKFKWRGVLKFIWTIFIFTIVNILLCACVGKLPGTETLTWTILFPVSRGKYWFMQVYLALLLTAPLLNAGLRELSLKDLRVLIGVLTLFTIYSCAIGHNLCNITGQTYMQGIYLYCLGHYLHRDDTLYRRIPQWGCIAIYLVMKGIIALCLRYKWSLINYLNYNSLPALIAAVALFIVFTRLKFRSKFVNYLGAASFGCYLLQDGLFGNQYFYGVMHRWYLENSLWVVIGLSALTYLGIWGGAVLIHFIRERCRAKLKIKN